MSDLLAQLISSHGAEVAQQISGKFGVAPEKAAAVLPAVAPMILGGLQRQAQEHGGAERVEHIVDKYGNDGILDNLGGFLSQKADEEDAPDPGLGGLLGNAGNQATDVLSNKLGLGKGAAMKILPMLAPVILGFLMKQKKQAGGGAAGQNVIMGMIDRDGDGSILDDVGGMLGGGVLGSLLGGGVPQVDTGQQQQSSGGGILSKILGGLGGLFGRKR